MDKKVWIYDYRTNVHHTLKKNPMKFSDLEDFIKCYNPENRHSRKRLGVKNLPKASFENSAMTKLYQGIKQIWTYSGSKTKVSLI
nr:hypothetical protein [Methanosarcina sp. DH2]